MNNSVITDVLKNNGTSMYYVITKGGGGTKHHYVVQCNLDLVKLDLVTTYDIVTIFQRPFLNLLST